MLVLDTNVVMAPGRLLQELVESKRWTLIIPLAIITELDGLQNNSEPVGPAAKSALAYLEKSLKTHGKWLKVQTSKGSYLPDLSIRFEEIDFGDSNDDPDSKLRSLDEVILRAISWHQANFVDRLAILADNPSKERAKVTPATSKAVLLTLDRNLRLKARARGLPAASQGELANILSMHPPG